MSEPMVIVGREEIARSICVSPRAIARLVREEDLPAWRESMNCPWKALPNDLRAWLQQRRDRFMQTGKNTK